MVANPQGMEDFKVRDPLKRLAYAPFRAWVRAGCRAADRVIATDHSTRDEVPAYLGVDPAKVVVIPNGVDVHFVQGAIDADTQRKLALQWEMAAGSGHTLRGISVGRLEANKGFAYLLRALHRAADELPADWGWLIVGDGSLRGELESLCAELGLSGHLRFTGSVSDAELHNLYSLSNLFAHPTLYEGSSLVTLEAMAHGLPVVASAVGGIPDKVLEGETGFLVQPADGAALADRIEWLATRPDEAAEMGARGRLLAADKFGWDRIAAQTEELFLELLEEKAACCPPAASRPR
jgi:glycosyltransferase involved in cell wall biosynthesis